MLLLFYFFFLKDLMKSFIVVVIILMLGVLVINKDSISELYTAYSDLKVITYADALETCQPNLYNDYSDCFIENNQKFLSLSITHSLLIAYFFTSFVEENKKSISYGEANINKLAELVKTRKMFRLINSELPSAMENSKTCPSSACSSYSKLWNKKYTDFMEKTSSKIGEFQVIARSSIDNREVYDILLKDVID